MRNSRGYDRAGTVSGRRAAGKRDRTSRRLPLWWLGAVLVLAWSLAVPANAGLTTGPAQDWRTAAVTVDAGCPEATAAGQIVYGCSDLSKNLQKARLWLKDNKRFHPDDKLYKNAARRTSNYAIARLKDGTLLIGYSDIDKHAEERLIEQIEGTAPRIVWDPVQGKVVAGPQQAGEVDEIYTELEPCKERCSRALADAKLSNKVSWSWRYNGANRTAQKQIRRQSNDRKSGLKPLAIRKLFATRTPGRIDDAPNVKNGAVDAVQRQAAAKGNGGIDFSSVQLRYMNDGGDELGNKYSFQAPTITGSPSTDGTDAVYDSFDAFDVWVNVEPSKFWVNLNPDEPNRIIDPVLGVTDVGRVLLQADLQLKESGTALDDPNKPIGKEFWRQMDAAGLDSMCTRNWIVPGPATVRESGSELYILDAPLVVKSEGDNFSIPNGKVTCPVDSSKANDIYKSVIVPELQREVNEAPEFADLRRIYISRVAAEWYRQRKVRAGTADDFDVDSDDTSVLEAETPWNPMDIYNKYVSELGATTYTDPTGRTIIDGGVDFTAPVSISSLSDGDFKTQHPALPAVVEQSFTDVTKTPDNKNAYDGGADVIPPLPPAGSEPSASPIAAGHLPVTGVPITGLIALGTVLLGIGFVIMWRTRRPSRLPK